MNIIDKVRYHHEKVKDILSDNEFTENYEVLFTSLIGSQNYNLDNENSDIDTFSIVLPDFMNFIRDKKKVSFIKEVSDGQCTIKDFRLIMELLRKTTPNSVEVFSSHYIIMNPKYEPILKKYLFDKNNLFYLTHADFHSMLAAIKGVCTQLHGRNMTIGKKYSHVIRLQDMTDNFLNTENKPDIFSMSEQSIKEAREAKFDLVKIEEEKLLSEINSLAQYIDYINTNLIPQTVKQVEYNAKTLINHFQYEITKKYLENFNFKEFYDNH